MATTQDIERIRQSIGGLLTPQNVERATKNTPSLFSSDLGVKPLIKAQQTEQKLKGSSQPIPQQKSAETTQKTTKDNGYAEFINPETEQSQKRPLQDLTEEEVSSLSSQGYQFSGGEGNIPSWVSDQSQLGSAELRLKQLKTQLDQFKNNLFNLDVSNDPELQASQQSINRVYNQRYDLLAERQASLEKTGYEAVRGAQSLTATTGRYSDAAQQIPQSVKTGISIQEQKIAREIENLRLSQVDDLTKARKLYEQGKWSEYVDVVNLAQDAYTEQLDKYVELQKEINTENDKLKKEQDAYDRASLMSEVISTYGVDNAVDLISTMNSVGYPITLTEAKDAITTLIPEAADDPLEKFSGDVRDFMMLRRDYPELLPPDVDNPFKYARYMTDVKTKLSAAGSGAVGSSPTSSEGRATPGDISISSIEEIKNLPVSDVTKAVMAGYMKTKDLTPTDRAMVASELFKVGFNPNQYILNKLNGLVALYAAMPEDQRGVVEGFVKMWAPYTNPKVAAFESAKTVLTREVARLFDVGMLSDQDVASYNEAMPSRMNDSLAVVLSKVGGLAQSISGKAFSQNVGKIITLKDGRQAIVGFDGETLLDLNTGVPLEQ